MPSRRFLRDRFDGRAGAAHGSRAGSHGPGLLGKLGGSGGARGRTARASRSLPLGRGLARATAAAEEEERQQQSDHDRRDRRRDGPEGERLGRNALTVGTVRGGSHHAGVRTQARGDHDAEHPEPEGQRNDRPSSSVHRNHPRAARPCRSSMRVALCKHGEARRSAPPRSNNSPERSTPVETLPRREVTGGDGAARRPTDARTAEAVRGAAPPPPTGGGLPRPRFP